mmetsp:Transcript_9278/g.26636  ORF Transcript_9278/g.26636 Transcript_9278/m.26636 type:complete len:268 (-) Transcript_9278:689-1492(-)
MALDPRDELALLQLPRQGDLLEADVEGPDHTAAKHVSEGAEVTLVEHAHPRHRGVLGRLGQMRRRAGRVLHGHRPALGAVGQRLHVRRHAGPASDHLHLRLEAVRLGRERLHRLGQLLDGGRSFRCQLRRRLGLNCHDIQRDRVRLRREGERLGGARDVRFQARAQTAFHAGLAQGAHRRLGRLVPTAGLVRGPQLGAGNASSRVYKDGVPQRRQMLELGVERVRRIQRIEVFAVFIVQDDHDDNGLPRGPWGSGATFSRGEMNFSR